MNFLPSIPELGGPKSLNSTHVPFFSRYFSWSAVLFIFTQFASGQGMASNQDFPNIPFRSSLPFLSNYSLGTVEIVESWEHIKYRTRILFVTNTKVQNGVTNTRTFYRWVFNDEPEYFYRTNFVPPEALLKSFSLAKAKLSEENSVLTLGFSQLPTLNLRNVILYSSRKLLARVKPEEIASFDDLIETKTLIDQVSNFQQTLKSGKLLSQSGYLRLYYPSAISGNERSLELLVPRIPVVTNEFRRPFRIAYDLDDEAGITLKDKSFGSFNTNGDLVWAKPQWIDERDKFSKRNKKFFDEFRGIIETTIPVRKDKVYLASSMASLSGLVYFSYAPTRYAAVGMFESSDEVVKIDLGKLTNRLGGLDKPNIFLISRGGTDSTNGTRQVQAGPQSSSSVSNVTQYLRGLCTPSVQSVNYSVSECGAAIKALENYFELKSSPLAPPSIRYTVQDPDLGGSRHYLTVDSLLKNEKPGTIQFQMTNNVASINLSNVDSFTIDLGYPLFQSQKRIDISINGRTVFSEEPKFYSSVEFLGEGISYFLK